MSPRWPVPEVPGGGGPIATRGRHAVEVFNAAGLDANTFGYNELDFAPDRLGEQVARSRFRWVSANVRDGSRPSEVLAAEQGARRWTLERMAGLRIGITGVVSPHIRLGDGGNAARVAPAVALLDPVKGLREVVPQLRAAGAQVVVILSHLFYEEMEQVTQEVDGIDVMVGSHHGRSPTISSRSRASSAAQSCRSPAMTWPRSASSTSSSNAATGGLCDTPSTGTSLPPRVRCSRRSRRCWTATSPPDSGSPPQRPWPARLDGKGLETEPPPRQPLTNLPPGSSH